MKKILLIVLAFVMITNVLSANTIDEILAPKDKNDKVGWLKYHAALEKQAKLSKAAALSDRKAGTHNGNRVRTLFYNYGSIGKPSTEPSMEWPIGSGRGYAFEFGVIAGAKIKTRGGQDDIIVSDGLTLGGVSYSANGFENNSGDWQPLPGYNDPFQPSIAMSDAIDTDRDLKPDSWPSGWYNPAFGDFMWPGEYGQGITTADQESYYVMDDYYIKSHNTYWPQQGWSDSLRDDEFYPAFPIDTVRGGLGLQVEARGYQWIATRAQNVIFFVYELQNVGEDTLDNMYFGMYGDPHVGGSNDYNDDDAYFDTYIDIVYGWDDNAIGDPIFGTTIPGFFGYKFLESPGEPRDGIDNDDDGMVDESMQDGIDNDGDWTVYTDWNLNGAWDRGEPINDDLGTDGVGPDDPQYIGPDTDGTESNGMPDPGEPNFDEKDLDEADQIGLTGFVVEIYSRATRTEDYYYSSRLSAPIDTSDFLQRADNIFMYSSGPIKMAPKDTRRFSIAMLFGYNSNAATGEDLWQNTHNVRDLYATADIMQEIYDAGYRFVKPPNKPRLTAIPGDQSVTLYWDDSAEKSRDPLFGNDFEGYAIYRATDFGFNEALDITDTYGSPYLWKPIAKFDLDNNISGPHAIEQIKNSGLHYDMGSNTGLVHSFVDENLVNGMRYFYAICAYDSGSVTDTIPPTETAKTIQEDFSGNVLLDINTAVVTPQAPALGYVAPKVLPVDEDAITAGSGVISFEIIDPTLVPDGRTIEVRFEDSGMDLVDNDMDWESYTDANLSVYNSPHVDLLIEPTGDSTYYSSTTNDTLTMAAELDKTFEHNGQTWIIKAWLEGATQTGDTVIVSAADYAIGPTLSVWDPTADGSVFDDVGADGCSDGYENADGSCSDTLLAVVPGSDPHGDNWHPVTNPLGTEANGKPDTGEPDFDLTDFDELSRATQSFSVHDVTDPANEFPIMEDQVGLYGEDFNQISNGMQVFVYNDTLMINDELTAWHVGDSYWKPKAALYDKGTNTGVRMPLDYEISFYPEVVDTSLEINAFSKNGPALTYMVKDLHSGEILNVLASSDFDGIRPLRTQSISPAIYSDESKSGNVYGDDLRLTWEFTFTSPLDQVWSIFPAEDGVMVGTETSGLGIYNQETGGWKFYNETSSGGGLLNRNKIKDIIHYEGYYWIATQNGPSIFDGNVWYRNHTLETLFDEFKVDSEATLEDPDKTKSYGAAVAFDVDALGNLWIGTYDEGLVRVKTNQTYLTSFDDDIMVVDDSISTDLKSLSATGLNDMLIRGQHIWIATDKGVVSYNYANNTWQHYTKSDIGISNDDIYVVEELPESVGGGLAFGYKEGLFFMVGDTFAIAPDSLLPLTFRSNGQVNKVSKRVYSFHATDDEKLYVGASKGYSILDLSNVSDDFSSGLNSTAYFSSWGDSTIYSSSTIRAISFVGDIGYYGTEEGLEQQLGEYEWNSFGPQPGDVLHIRTRKEYSSLDVFQYNTTAAKADAVDRASDLDRVSVVPNPYVAAAIWEQKPYLTSGRGERKIHFINLPTECTIRIYTMTGELVRKLEHYSPSSNPDKTLFDGAESWDLLNLDNLEVAYGVYIYHIETDNAETIGKFAVIK